MVINHDKNTPTTQCPDCHDQKEIIDLIIHGSGLHCPDCLFSGDAVGLCGYVNDLCGTGVEEFHLIRL